MNWPNQKISAKTNTVHASQFTKSTKTRSTKKLIKNSKYSLPVENKIVTNLTYHDSHFKSVKKSLLNLMINNQSIRSVSGLKSTQWETLPKILITVVIRARKIRNNLKIHKRES